MLTLVVNIWLVPEPNVLFEKGITLELLVTMLASEHELRMLRLDVGLEILFGLKFLTAAVAFVTGLPWVSASNVAFFTQLES